MSPSKLGKRDPFQFSARADWQKGKLGTDVEFKIPKNKRLVIENISAHHEAPIKQEVTSTSVRTIVKNVVAWHSVFVPQTGTFEKRLNVYSGGQRVRVYADPGTAVHVLVNKNSSLCPAHCGSTQVYISGYLLSVNNRSLAP